ncbi:acyl-CoA thioesterase [Salinicoccus hispanicus]|uniref:Acyl-CoA thioesterase n=1 Tax=Salinicoccus hispanicus TaxID=157225 RepID=A0A6N8U1E0_9STAP|nr:acyl-CoA thioesterase [Salinicoccus hispanicus]MXQ51890.1 acyl-CoA thioesterase [Salinicoccus hispanicus]
MQKRMSESYTVKTSNVMPPDTNSHHTLYGGRLMEYIDDVASIAARRHSRAKVVTASIDSVDFLEPINLGDVVILESMVTHTGRSSMEILVKISKETLENDCERKLAAFSFLTFVALDDNYDPIEVPEVIPDNERLKWLDETGEERSEHRRHRRERSKALREFFATDLLD